jgi:NAD(P)-dependent dehydrogenase (short-subunit alcohol dehydrogenase family)
VERPVIATADITDDVWNRILAVNLTGVFLCMQHEIPLLLSGGGGGAIVNTSSGARVIGLAGQAAYAAAKHGVIGLTKSTALDYAAAGVRINAVCPGITDAAMIDRFTGGTEDGRARVISQEPIGRMGRPEEIASAVLWLCSDLGALQEHNAPHTMQSGDAERARKLPIGEGAIAAGRTMGARCCRSG